MLFVILFVFGAIVGSFLNVCIFRLPKGESIVWPASHCLSCRHPIAWHDNIPVASFFVLRGRCRHCQAKISFQYVIVEVVSACLFVLFYKVFGLSVKGVMYLGLSLALVVQAFIDFRHRIIPDEITLPGIILGLTVSAVFPRLHGQISHWTGFWQSLLGLLVGGGFLYAAGSLAEFFLKKEAMGGGDVKLLAMIGTLVGWGGVLWTVFVSSLIGSVGGLYARLVGGEERIPFGPYLGLAAFLYLFFGGQTISWYTHSLGLY